MDFKRLADIKVLHEKTLAAARAERAATFHLLECLHQIENTKAHLELSYPTLFEYVHRGLQYSESQAYERIAAMRLAFKIPEVARALKSGELTLTSTARIAQHAKRESLAPESIAGLAKSLVHRSVREVEKVLAAEAKVLPPKRETLRPSSSSTSTLIITVDAEFEALLKEARELETDPTVSIAEVLKRALKMRVEATKRKRGARPDRRSENVSPDTGVVHSAESGKDKEMKIAGVAVDNRNQKKSRRYIPLKTRHSVWSVSSGQCSFISPVTGMRCPSRQSLQIDHRFALALGGSDHPKNLELLCANHNRAKGMG